MKRLFAAILIITILFSLAACAQKAEATWQEQYDLGVRYLNEGKYEEAILAFTAAIEIDLRKAEAYLGRADAYIDSGEAAENLAAALADYEAVIELNKNEVDGWLGLADVYIRIGEYDLAIEVLREALSYVGEDGRITEKLETMISGNYADSDGNPRKTVEIQNGEIVQYWLWEYDEAGNNVRTSNYLADDTLESTTTSEFNEQGQKIKSERVNPAGSVITETYEYDAAGRCVRENMYWENPDQTIGGNYTLITYDDALRTETHTQYVIDCDMERLSHVFVIEYDGNGIRTRGSNYLLDENGELYLNYYVDYIWNTDGSFGGFVTTHVATDE